MDKYSIPKESDWLLKEVYVQHLPLVSLDVYIVVEEDPQLPGFEKRKALDLWALQTKEDTKVIWIPTK